MADDLPSLMLRYVDGDPAAFRALYDALAPRLLGYLAGMARDRGRAEDLLQLTFLKIHRARGSYVRGADPAPWMFAIAHRTFLDEARARGRARVGSTATGDVPDVAAPPPEAPTTDAGQRAQVLAALQQLPEAQRQAVVLTKLDGRSMADAAAIAGTSVGSMKVRAHRGLAALRRLLGGSGEQEGGAA
jgi:RNA polymerase sigma-70 factor (ECF subfamily)